MWHRVKNPPLLRFGSARSVSNKILNLDYIYGLDRRIGLDLHSMMVPLRILEDGKHQFGITNLKPEFGWRGRQTGFRKPIRRKHLY